MYENTIRSYPKLLSKSRPESNHRTTESLFKSMFLLPIQNLSSISTLLLSYNQNLLLMDCSICWLITILMMNYLTRGQAEREFKVEVEAIGRVRHKNLVRLLGYCVEGAYR